MQNSDNRVKRINQLPPKLIVTRAILQARCVDQRVQACTPTLLYSLVLDKGQNV